MKTDTARLLRQNLATFAIKTSLEKLVRRAKRSGVVLVADADAMAIRLIPADGARAADDLRKLGTTVSLHDACGGGASAIGGHPITHGT